MTKGILVPDYIFESSWEVCNKVGGIYTVLSTRAKTLQDQMHDRIIFIGPDCWGEKPCPYFLEDKSLFPEWCQKAITEDLKIKVGRWDIPGQPIAILVDFQPYFAQKDVIYGKLWESFQVDSLHAYGDYDEASMFSYAAALVVESFYKNNLSADQKVIYHGNEWMTGLGVLYINKVLPEIGTVFTTHATSIGRSIAGNNKPLYDYLFAYNGDQMSWELNMQSKHSIEKQTAHHVDCFTTVSDITANECKELLDKPVDFVLPNGFDNSFVPKGAVFTRKRKQARKRLQKRSEQNEQNSVYSKECHYGFLAQAPCRQVTFRRTRILGIDIGIGNAVEAHRAVACSHHTADNQQDNPRSLRDTHSAKTVCRHPHGTYRKRHREKRMTKAHHVPEFKNLFQHRSLFFLPFRLARRL